MLEGTDGRVTTLSGRPKRRRGAVREGCKPHSVIRLRRLSIVRGPVVEVNDMGESEAILSNMYRLREIVRDMAKRGVTPQDDGWNGWLGRVAVAIRPFVRAVLTLNTTFD